MSISPAGELLFSVPYAYVMGASLLLAVHLIRKPELVKARFFLNFGKFRAAFVVLLAAGIAAMSASLLYTLSGGYGTELFESWGLFFREEGPSLVIFSGVCILCADLWRTLR